MIIGFKSHSIDLGYVCRLLVLGSLVVNAACASKGITDSSNVERISLQTEEREREYLLYVPESLKENTDEKALVLVMHGGGGTAEFSANEIGPTLFRLSEEEGFYVVFPNAVNKIWDFGEGRISEQLDERVDDYSYFEAVLDDAFLRLPIDPARVFVTGISRGGQASYFMACQFPDRIRAIAPVAMPLPAYLEDDCQSGPPIGVAIMNGTEDPLVPYDGGAITIAKKERDMVLSTSDTLELWQKRNGCDPESTAQSTIDEARDQTRVEKTEWANCTGAPVVLYKIVGGGHAWPSGKQYLPKFIVGKVNKDIDGAEEAWGFFRQFQ